MRKCVLFFAGLVITSHLFGAVTGKIQGKATDKSTGEPLPFVNVVIEGTTMGAATSMEGEYFIINAPVGTYTLSASMMGYKTLRVENVKVSADMTTRMDFLLEPTVIVGEEVVVTAERPMVQRDMTSSTRIMAGEEIEKMPVSNYEDIVASQSGAVETRAGLSGGLHIRGGRANEIVYIVDGINVNDPVSGESGMNLSNSAIEEMQVVTGGFKAEYGEAMSGVVKIVTKEGRDIPMGGIKYTTDRGVRFGDRNYDFGYDNIDLTLGGPFPMLKKLTFFISGNYVDTDGRLPHTDLRRRSSAGKISYTPAPWFKMRLSGDYTDTEYHTYSHSRSRGDWLKDTFKHHTGNSRLNLTITHTISDNTFYDFTVGYFNTFTKFSPQDGKHFNDWEVITDVLPWVQTSIDSGWYDPEERSWNDGMTPDLAWRLFYENRGYCAYDSAAGEWYWTGDDLKTQLMRAREALNNRLHSVNSWQYVADENGDTVDLYYHYFDIDKYIEDIKLYMDGVIKEDEIEPSGNMYRIRYSRDEWNRFNYNFIPWWQDRNTQHIEAKIDLTSQLNKYNQIKTGGFLRRYNLKLTEIQFINPNPYTDRYEKQPLAGAFYIQDKIEFEDLTTNLGVRADYFDPNSEFYVDLEHPIEMDKAKPKIQVSPRFGISFSVTDKSLMYANYGHFFQVIDLEDMYQNLQGDLTAGYVLIGNPDIPPQRTIAYEVGFKHLLTPDIRFDVTGYLKDVDNLLATREIKTLVIDKLFDYTVYEPVDFAIVKGFEIGIIKRPSEFISGSIGYAYMDAKGTGSSGREFYYRYRDTEAEIPTREYPLEFDVTHTVKAGINLYLPDGFGPILFGLKPLSNFNTNVQYNFSSGPPYTPTDERDNPLEEGSKRLPATSTLDLRMDKTLFFGPIPLGVFLDVRNLLDKKNVVDIYTRTGIPDDNGERPVWDERYYTSRYEERGYSSPEEMWRADLENWKRYVDTPANYGNPRIIRFGVLFNF